MKTFEAKYFRGLMFYRKFLNFMLAGVWELLKTIPSLKPTSSYLKIILPMFVNF